MHRRRLASLTLAAFASACVAPGDSDTKGPGTPAANSSSEASDIQERWYDPNNQNTLKRHPPR